MKVSLERARALVRAMRKASETVDRLARSELYCQILVALVGGELAAIVAMEDFRPGGNAPVVAMVGHGWSDEVTRYVLPPMAERGALIEPTVAALANVSARSHVARRKDLVDRRTWERDWFVQEHRRAAGLDDELLGMTRSSTCASSVIGVSVHRAIGQRPFSVEDRELLGLFIDLGGLEPALVATPRLSPRESQVLGALHQGANEKQIAAELGLSAHTVHEYAKALHRKFGARSRAELLARTRRA